jgi:hypothetical protein
MIKTMIVLALIIIGALFSMGAYAMLVVNRWARDYLAPTRKTGGQPK